MRNLKYYWAFVLLLMASCASIPRETVTLSKAIGNDLQVVYASHINTVKMYYDQMEENINSFINDDYYPQLMQARLQVELDKLKNGDPSLYSIIAKSGKSGDEKDNENAMRAMFRVTDDVNQQALAQKNALLTPLLKQKKEVLAKIDSSYQNMIYANATLTAFLESARKVKETQSKALSDIGLGGFDSVITNQLIELSKAIDSVITKANDINEKSDNAQIQIEEIKGLIEKFNQFINQQK